MHETRMHSSRMRTGRSLTVCRSLLLGGGDGGRGSPNYADLGVSLAGGVSLTGGSPWQGGLLGRGSQGPTGQGSSWQGGGTPAGTVADPPPVNRMTDRCKNITLATTSLRKR